MEWHLSYLVPSHPCLTLLEYYFAVADWTRCAAAIGQAEAISASIASSTLNSKDLARLSSMKEIIHHLTSMYPGAPPKTATVLLMAQQDFSGLVRDHSEWLLDLFQRQVCERALSVVCKRQLAARALKARHEGPVFADFCLFAHVCLVLELTLWEVYSLNGRLM